MDLVLVGNFYRQCPEFRIEFSILLTKRRRKTNRIPSQRKEDILNLNLKTRNIEISNGAAHYPPLVS